MMSVRQRLAERWPSRWPVQPFDEAKWASQTPTYREADPRVIEAAAARAAQRPAGNWYVFAASRNVRPGTPLGFTVGGQEFVAWRDEHAGLLVGPGACPHLGAALADARVDGGQLVCRWHGLRLGAATGGKGDGWSPLPCHDDGVLCWVRVDSVGNEVPTSAPIVASRPPAAGQLDAVATMIGVCEPRDIIANRLDPWHGAWLHPYAFARLRVLEAPAGTVGPDAGNLDADNLDVVVSDTADTPDTAVCEALDRFLVEVTFRVAGRWGVPVRAEFRCPGPRTVTMRILDGEGVGSVVETHATPLGPGPDGLARTSVIEATIAASTRPGFRVARQVAPLLRPLIRHTAARLWRDDLAYAERRYALRAARG